MAKLDKQIQGFRRKATKMTEGTQKLRAVYPGLYRVFCTTDHSFEMDDQNFYERLDQSRNRTNKKYSLYVASTNKKVPRLTKNKSMNISLFEGPNPQPKQADSKLTEHSGYSHSRGDNSDVGTRSGNDHDQLLRPNSKASKGGFYSMIKISVISNSQNEEKDKMLESEENNRRTSLFQKKSREASRKPGDSEGGESRRLLHSGTSKSIFQSVKSSKAEISEKEAIESKKPEIETYAQLIEKTGKFNIIPDINKNPVYNQFQQKLHELLGTSTESRPRPNLNALSIKSSVFNLQIEHDQKQSESPESRSRQFSTMKPDRAKGNGSFSQGKASDSLTASLFLNVHSANQESSSQMGDYLPDDQNEIIEMLKKNKIFWKELVPKSAIEDLIEQFEVKKCEKLFLSLVFIFEADLSNIVPRFAKIMQKLRSKGAGETDKPGPARNGGPRTRGRRCCSRAACQVS